MQRVTFLQQNERGHESANFDYFLVSLKINLQNRYTVAAEEEKDAKFANAWF